MKQEERQNSTSERTNADLIQARLLSSVDCLHAMYSLARPIDKAKYGYLLLTVVSILPLAAFAAFRESSIYSELKKAMTDFDSRRRAFRSNGIGTKSSAVNLMKKQDAKNKKVLVCPDARVQYVESKTDTLAEQLSSLTLSRKNG